MLRVIDCLTLRHDFSLVALAALICVLGSISTTLVAGRVLATRRPVVWTALLCLSLGATAWSTHFVAMLAYRLSVPTTYAIGPTLLSLLAGLAFVGVGCTCAARWRERTAARRLGGALVGGGVLALHYIGMSALRFPGTLTYSPDLVIGSVVAGLGFGAAALSVMFGPLTHWNRPLGAALLLLMTISLHFLGMGAAEVALAVDDGQGAAGMPRSMLAAGVAIISLMVLAIGTAAALVDNRVSRHLAHLARHDSLTDLPNRRYFRELAAQTLERAARTGTSFAVFAIDLDDFKPVNDVYGHAAGDSLIRSAGQRTAALLEEGDILARLGGDEFALITVARARSETAARLAILVQAALGTPTRFGDVELQTNASIGIAIYPDHGDDIDTLLRHADTAMYRAKAVGKGISLFFEPAMNAELESRRRLESRLRLAPENGSLSLHYQPLVSSGDRQPVGFEALLRWEDDELGGVQPSEFIPVAESTGLIVPIGRFVLEQACHDAAAWPDPLRVAVNLSALQFTRGGLVDTVRLALARSGLPGERLELEITESLLLDDRERTLSTLTELRRLGVRIAMDDFGSGYSSLGYLQSFKFDKIKIDRSFVSDIGNGLQDAGILRAAIAMGQCLGMCVVAEGVETDTQAELLAGLECDELQGYLIARPMPSYEVASYLGRAFREPGRERPPGAAAARRSTTAATT